MGNKIMKKDRTIRIRAAKWEAIEKIAWDLMHKENIFIKPTDIADALIWKSLKDFTIEDYKEAIKDR